MPPDSGRKLVDFRELKDTAKGDELEALTDALLKTLGFQTVRSGRGADGGRDLLCIETTASPLAQRTRRWLVQCKHFAEGGRAVNEQDIGSIIDLCSKHDARGFLIVTTTTVTNELRKRMEAISTDQRQDLVVGYWDEHRLRELLLAPAQVEILKQFLPDSYARVRGLEAHELLLQQLQQRGASVEDVEHLRDEIHDVILRTERRERLSSERIFPAASQHRSDMDEAISAFLAEDTERCALALEGLPFEEWLALTTAFGTEDPALAQTCLEAVAERATEEDRRFAAVQAIVEVDGGGLNAAIPLLHYLDTESQRTIIESFGLEEIIRRTVESLSEKEPSTISSLPAHRTTAVYLEDWQWKVQGELIRVDADLSWELEISSDGGEEYHDRSFTGTATLTVTAEDDVSVDQLRVDTDKFYGPNEPENHEPP